METASNKETMRRIYEEGITKGDWVLMRQLCTAECVSRDAPPSRQGFDAEKEAVERLRTAFPDLQFVIQDAIAEGDRVAARVVGTATHRGEFMGVPATGKSVQIRVMDIGRFEDGKLAEHWESFGGLSLLSQLGAWPPKRPT